MKKVPVLISLYTIYSRRKGRNVGIMNASRMVIVFLISPFVLPFLHLIILQIDAETKCVTNDEGWSEEVGGGLPNIFFASKMPAVVAGMGKNVQSHF